MSRTREDEKRKNKKRSKKGSSVNDRKKSTDRKYMEKRKRKNQRKAGKNNTKKGKSIGKVMGRLISIIQLLISIVLLITIGGTGLLPMKYFLILAAMLLMLFGITFALQFVKGKAYIGGILLSILMSIVMVVGIIYVKQANQMLLNVGGATYKTDNMVVVVRADDPAKNLTDAADYVFGMQTSVDTVNTKEMRQEITDTLKQDIQVKEYETLIEVTDALLSGEIDAAFYNEAYVGPIQEHNPSYLDKVKVIYQYGIHVKIEREETNIEEPFNVYISGIDVSGPITTNSRSDVNLIMTVNPNTKKILLTTTPRDYYVTLPGVSGEQRDKLTHAGIYGVDVSMNTLENVYGIDISYYARVNFTSLITIVDLLGGVDVNSEFAFTTTHGGFEIHEGINHMNGEMALGFCRERYSFTDGDNQRGKNQQAVLTAILNKAISPAILTNAPQLLASVGGNVETNMTQDEMAKFINRQLSEGTGWTIESVSATGSGDMQPCFSSGDQPLSVMWPDEAVVSDISKRMQQILSEK